MICDECETVAHCLKNGCVPKHQALDRMVENARELGLDYEPVQQSRSDVEPVEFFDWYDNAHWGNEDFKEGCHRSWNAAIKYTTPLAAKRPWIGLTDEDIEQEFGFIDELLRDCVHRTEAKLKEKNCD